MARILILGGGFGGLAAANALLPALAGGHSVTLIDRKDRFRLGLAKLWILVGERQIDDGVGDLARLRAKGVAYIKSEIERIDPVAKRVRTTDGEHAYDCLIVAMGADVSPELVPGLPAEANLYDATKVPGLRRELERLDKGSLALVVCSAPYKCPPAPFEAAMLVHERLRQLGRRDAVEIAVYIPDPQPMPVAGAAAGQKARELLAERGIALHAGHKLVSVDAAARELAFETPGGAERRRYDLLLAVPPHRAPQAVRDSGLTDASGWIAVDPGTLATPHANLYAVGDVTVVKLPGSGMLPKAGIMAELEAQVVASNILAQLDGRAASAGFDGKGYCFFEVGGRQAMLVQGEFFREPGNRVVLSPPSPETFALKQQFERERLTRWF